ncbi:MAG: prepilin-type N-terminal cleavage/methylation domain-containing protein [Thermodesulfobacteriota bacterium]
MNRRKEGFTLLEILIAILIFGMVISLAYSSYNATFHIIGDAEAKAETYSKAKTAMERISNDLESFYLGEKPLFKGESGTMGEYRADSLEFTSTAAIRLHPDDVPIGHVIIRYSVEEDPDSKSLKLYRSEQPALVEEEGPEPPLFLLCDTLQEVAFDYRDGEGEDVKEWGEEEGSSSPPLPSLVTVSLRFKDGEEDQAGTLFTTSLTLPVAKGR